MNRVIAILKNAKLFILAAIVTLIIYLYDNTLGINIIQTFGMFFKSTIPILLLMFALLAFIKLELNSKFFETKLLAEKEWKKVFFAYCFGTIVSGPIYPGYMLGKMLMEKGVKARIVVIMLSVWATLKIPMLPYEVEILGLDLCVVRWIVTGIAIYIMAVLCEYTVKYFEVKLLKK